GAGALETAESIVQRFVFANAYFSHAFPSLRGSGEPPGRGRVRETFSVRSRKRAALSHRGRKNQTPAWKRFGPTPPKFHQRESDVRTKSRTIIPQPKRICQNHSGGQES